MIIEYMSFRAIERATICTRCQAKQCSMVFLSHPAFVPWCVRTNVHNYDGNVLLVVGCKGVIDELPVMDEDEGPHTCVSCVTISSDGSVGTLEEVEGRED